MWYICEENTSCEGKHSCSDRTLISICISCLPPCLCAPAFMCTPHPIPHALVRSLGAVAQDAGRRVLRPCSACVLHPLCLRAFRQARNTQPLPEGYTWLGRFSEIELNGCLFIMSPCALSPADTTYLVSVRVFFSIGDLVASKPGVFCSIRDLVLGCLVAA